VPLEAGPPDALVAAPALDVLEDVPPALAVDPAPAPPAPPVLLAPPAPLAEVDAPVDADAEEAAPVPPDVADAVLDDPVEQLSTHIQQPTMQ
jgi:hypothetical protein